MVFISKYFIIADIFFPNFIIVAANLPVFYDFLKLEMFFCQVNMLATLSLLTTVVDFASSVHSFVVRKLRFARVTFGNAEGNPPEPPKGKQSFPHGLWPGEASLRGGSVLLVREQVPSASSRLVSLQGGEPTLPSAQASLVVSPRFARLVSQCCLVWEPTVPTPPFHFTLVPLTHMSIRLSSLGFSFFEPSFVQAHVHIRSWNSSS